MRPRAITVVGLILAALALAAFLVAQISVGQPIWLNVWRQPVSLFLVIPVLILLAVIGGLSHFRWRHQRPASRRNARHR